MIRGLKGLLLGGLFAAVSHVTYAESADQDVLTIRLEKLEKLTEQEASGDEIFFSITEYPKDQSARHYQVPSFPAHWVSDHLKGVKNIIIWEKPVAQCEPMDVIISLVEEDLMPWNVDDLLGSVKLRIQCENGKLAEKWIIPNSDNTQSMNKKKGTFVFHGEDAKYRAIFKFEKVPAKDVNKS